ncbi:bifunctional DNA primase/polymerase [Streptosporangium sp. NPDC006007]|uniref:bifunctional DNA primase/polymerase n=1 Tax=Streptosporangium sp. NPDC006007 TaxID=3154575 RepID=UPI0033B05D48
MSPHPTLRYALAAAARGWHVFPVSIGDKPPVKGFTDWEANATTDPATIRRWWARAPWNVGIACGPSGLVVIDLDTPKNTKEGLRPPPPWDLPGVTDGADVLAAASGHPGETGIKEGVDDGSTVSVDEGVAVPMKLDIVQTARADQIVVVLQRNAGLFSHEPDVNHVPQSLEGTTA